MNVEAASCRLSLEAKRLEAASTVLPRLFPEPLVSHGHEETSGTGKSRLLCSRFGASAREEKQNRTE